MHKNRIRGLTLLEVMVVVAILAILSIVALPGMGGVIRANRITTAVNEVHSAFSYARSEGLRTNASLIANPRIDIVLCPANAAANACGDDWSDGLLVVRRSATNVAEVLRHTQFSDRVELTLNAGSEPIFVFDHRGRVSGQDDSGLAVVPPTMVLKPADEDCKASEQTLSTMTVTGSGQFRSIRSACE